MKMEPVSLRLRLCCFMLLGFCSSHPGSAESLPTLQMWSEFFRCSRPTPNHSFFSLFRFSSPHCFRGSSTESDDFTIGQALFHTRWLLLYLQYPLGRLCPKRADWVRVFLEQCFYPFSAYLL